LRIAVAVATVGVATVAVATAAAQWGMVPPVTPGVSPVIPLVSRGGQAVLQVMPAARMWLCSIRLPAAPVFIRARSPTHARRLPPVLQPPSVVAAAL